MITIKCIGAPRLKSKDCTFGLLRSPEKRRTEARDLGEGRDGKTKEGYQGKRKAKPVRKLYEGVRWDSRESESQVRYELEMRDLVDWGGQERDPWSIKQRVDAWAARACGVADIDRLYALLSA